MNRCRFFDFQELFYCFEESYNVIYFDIECIFCIFFIFFSYVVVILEVLSDFNDIEKMKRVFECVRELLRKRKLLKFKGVLQDFFFFVEWFYLKEGFYINLLDLLLYYEDLVREYFKGKIFQY